MDIDGDGNRDVLSGCYPGKIHVFHGKADGTFAADEPLKDKGGEDLVVERASVPFAADWDGDGDLDVLVGDIQGHVNLFENQSGGKGLVFERAEALMADATAIQVPGGDSGPVVADWDGDGRQDLIVGAGDGSVLFFKNLARAGKPLLKAPELLVGPSKEHPQRGEAKDVPTSPCGARAKVAVGDYDGDGRLDLLLGDFCMVKPDPRELTEEEQKRRTELKAKQQALAKEVVPVYRDFYDKVLAKMGLEPLKREQRPDGTLPFPMKLPVPDARQREFRKLLTALMQEDEAVQAYQKKMQEVYEALRPLEGMPTPHGYVWVFLRKA